MTTALERLDRRGVFGIHPGLEVERGILEAMGNPEREYPCIHVAGTNGKGSVCAMLESVLRSAGFRTGLYVSPHLVRFNERICVNGVEATDGELEALAQDVEGVERGVAERLGKPATYFEFSTAMMFEHFKRRKVDIAVIETGMGGRLDATNVVVPAVAVITAIGMDHMAYLGPDLAAIAGEKAGIVKGGRPVVSGRQKPEAMAVIRRIAAELRAPLVLAGESVGVRRVSEDWTGQRVSIETGDWAVGSIRLPLLGDHQLENLATVAATVGVLRESGLTIDEKAIRKGVGQTVWPGRMQVLQSDPPVLLDGGHNPQAGAVVADFLKHRLKGRPLGIVLGMCRDKDLHGYLDSFRGMARRFWAVPIRTERSLSAAEVAAVARGVCREVTEMESAADGAREATSWARDAGGTVCIAGSLYLVGEILAGWKQDCANPQRNR
jgi:dihydrofolate synthase/folylpolyglutamate synthase